MLFVMLGECNSDVDECIGAGCVAVKSVSTNKCSEGGERDNKSDSLNRCTMLDRKIKKGTGAWLSFENGLEEYKENQLRLEWWYLVRVSAPAFSNPFPLHTIPPVPLHNIYCFTYTPYLQPFINSITLSPSYTHHTQFPYHIMFP